MPGAIVTTLDYVVAGAILMVFTAWTMLAVGHAIFQP
jgi:hypothetical protein